MKMLDVVDSGETLTVYIFVAKLFHSTLGLEHITSRYLTNFCLPSSLGMMANSIFRSQQIIQKSSSHHSITMDQSASHLFERGHVCKRTQIDRQIDTLIQYRDGAAGRAQAQQKDDRQLNMDETESIRVQLSFSSLTESLGASELAYLLTCFSKLSQSSRFNQALRVHQIYTSFAYRTFV